MKRDNLSLAGGWNFSSYKLMDTSIDEVEEYDGMGLADYC